ncbi:MAG: hypothetical protein ACLTEE_09865 [Anaerobutyricum hallii]
MLYLASGVLLVGSSVELVGVALARKYRIYLLERILGYRSSGISWRLDESQNFVGRNLTKDDMRDRTSGKFRIIKQESSVIQLPVTSLA